MMPTFMVVLSVLVVASVLCCAVMTIVRKKMEKEIRALRKEVK